MQRLTLTKRVDYCVAALSETEDSRRRDEWDAEEGFKGGRREVRLEMS